MEGTPVTSREGERLGLSRTAAREGISQVTVSRIGMAMPGMVLIPVIINSLERRGVLRLYPRLVAPLQVGLCGLILSLSTPLCCAIFQQRASIRLDKLEDHIQDQFQHSSHTPHLVYYNKGL